MTIKIYDEIIKVRDSVDYAFANYGISSSEYIENISIWKKCLEFLEITRCFDEFVQYMEIKKIR